MVKRLRPVINTASGRRERPGERKNENQIFLQPRNLWLGYRFTAFALVGNDCCVSWWHYDCRKFFLCHDLWHGQAWRILKGGGTMIRRVVPAGEVTLSLKTLERLLRTIREQKELIDAYSPKYDREQ